MTARVTALGYLRFTATDLDHWQDFGQRVLGLMADRKVTTACCSAWTRRATGSRCVPANGAA
ncbi:hypothetical protein SHIRM173S_07726 [Streptomyces hirsutus]